MSTAYQSQTWAVFPRPGSRFYACSDRVVLLALSSGNPLPDPLPPHHHQTVQPQQVSLDSLLVPESTCCTTHFSSVGRKLRVEIMKVLFPWMQEKWLQDSLPVTNLLWLNTNYNVMLLTMLSKITLIRSIVALLFLITEWVTVCVNIKDAKGLAKETKDKARTRKKNEASYRVFIQMWHSVPNNIKKELW